MSVRSKHLKLVGVAGAAALTVGVMSSPATAATANFIYSCDAPVGPTSVSFDPGTIPSTMVAGQSEAATGMSIIVKLNATQVATAEGIGADHVRGTVASTGSNNGMPFKATIPNTALPTPPAETDISLTNVTGTFRPLKAGTWNVKAGDMSSSLTFSASGTDITTLTPNCAAPTDGSNIAGTITVSKDSTTTTVGAAYSATKKTATGTAKVKSHFGLTATGKVTFVLKKGTTKVASQTKSLAKGAAKAVFSGVKKSGKYSITATYGGNAALKGSSGKASFTVK